MHSSSRNGARVRVLAVHTTEGIMRAADLRAWKSWAGSSHASTDETGALLTPADGFVPYDRASWTLRSGNPWSDNIELCGFAKWTRAQWLARPKLLDAAARWLADRSKARGIPLVKLTPQQYRAGQSGVIGHHDHTVGYSDGTHWDPGPGFPWDVVLSKAIDFRNATPASEEIDMTALYDTRVEGRNLFDWFIQLRGELGGQIAVLTQQVAALSKASGAQAVDPKVIADALKPVLAEAVAAGMSADNEAQAQKIVDDIVARLARPVS